nr:MAG TPA: hypothetical protein [Caudoviricetes sp.]
MKKYDNTIIYTMDELVDLLGGDKYNELNRDDEFGLAECYPKVCGLQIVFRADRFTENALNAVRHAIK